MFVIILLTSTILNVIKCSNDDEGMGINMHGTDYLQEFLYVEYSRNYGLLKDIYKYKYEKDNLLKPLKKIGFKEEEKNVRFSLETKIKMTELNEYTNKFFKESKIEYKNTTFLKKAIKNTEYVTYFSGVYTSEKTNETYFLSLFITKASPNDEVFNFFIISFRIQFQLCKKDYANEIYTAYTKSKGFGIPSNEEVNVTPKEKSGIKLKKKQQKVLHKIVKYFALLKCKAVYPKPNGDL